MKILKKGYHPSLSLNKDWKKYSKIKDVCNIIPAQLYLDAYHAGYSRAIKDLKSKKIGP